MLEIQVRLLMTLLDLTTMTRSRLRDAHDDWERGEVTSTTEIGRASCRERVYSSV